ncbi:MAG: glycosyltransferase family 2 protein [Elusimicrobia bacterium]|nr:glycosyltransferase family 2 protein [Elusimicrobiota bacterium]
MTPKISVVIPVYNEKENLKELARELAAAFAGPEAGIWESVWVDDGSSDGSYEELLTVLKGLPGAKLIRFARNFGQTAALSAGIAAASGEYIATMDADLQNDPADIGALFKKALEGCDVVSGWRKDRRDPFFTRRLPSFIANAIISKVTGVALHDYGCTLKIYKASLLKSAELYGEMHRFLPALLGYMGARIAELAVNHRSRKSGSSKYGLGRTFKVALDLFTVKFMGDFITKPIYLFGGLSLSLLFASGVMAAFTLYRKFFGQVFVKDQPLFLVAIFFALVGVQFAFLGLLAEILVRTYYRATRKPAYHIKETRQF